MPDETPEQAMRRACDAILRGDMYAAMAEFTPDALNEAMLLAGSLAGLSMPESYELESHEEKDGEHVFRVLFKAGVLEMRASARWREVDGTWKIVGVNVLS